MARGNCTSSITPSPPVAPAAASCHQRCADAPEAPTHWNATAINANCNSQMPMQTTANQGGRVRNMGELSFADVCTLPIPQRRSRDAG